MCVSSQSRLSLTGLFARLFTIFLGSFCPDFFRQHELLFLTCDVVTKIVNYSMNKILKCLFFNHLKISFDEFCKRYLGLFNKILLDGSQNKFEIMHLF